MKTVLAIGAAAVALYALEARRGSFGGGSSQGGGAGSDFGTIDGEHPWYTPEEKKFCEALPSQDEIAASIASEGGSLLTFCITNASDERCRQLEDHKTCRAERALASPFSPVGVMQGISELASDVVGLVGDLVGDALASIVKQPIIWGAAFVGVAYVVTR